MLSCTTSNYFCFVTQNNTIKCVNFSCDEITETIIISRDVVDSIVSLYYTCTNEFIAMTYDSKFMVFNVNNDTCEPLNLDVDDHGLVTINQYLCLGRPLWVCFSTHWIRVTRGTSYVKKISVDLAENEKIKGVHIYTGYLVIHTNLKIIVNKFSCGSADITSENIFVIPKKYKRATYYDGYFFFLNNSRIDVYKKKFENESFTIDKKFTMDRIVSVNSFGGTIHILGKTHNKFTHIYLTINKKNGDDIVVTIFGSNFYLHEFYSCEYDPQHLPNQYSVSCGHAHTCDCTMKYVIYTDKKTYVEFVEENTKTKSCYVMDYQIKDVFLAHCNKMIIVTDECVIKYYTIARDVDNTIVIKYISDDTHLIKNLSGKNTKKAQ